MRGSYVELRDERHRQQAAEQKRLEAQRIKEAGVKDFFDSQPTHADSSPTDDDPFGTGSPTTDPNPFGIDPPANDPNPFGIGTPD